jgi:hypothetical protein
VQGAVPVIYESWPWKQQLLKDADILERWATKPESDRRGYLLESKVFNSAYAMRKLAHSYKLSSSFDDRSVNCTRYPSVKPMTWQDRWQYWEHFDLESPKPINISALTLIDTIIHSYIFWEFVNEDPQLTTKFIVTSDWKRNKYLIEFGLEAYVGLMREAGQDHPSNIQMAYSEQDGDWRMWRGHGQAPPHIAKKLFGNRGE